ncbi:HD family phosphohydrolase [Priestia filamentosa]|uniref:HD family phosphohydrolase n=1 Tax=Priestia filamentosa TaxID=1402861 RepID=UPI0039828FE0
MLKLWKQMMEQLNKLKFIQIGLYALLGIFLFSIMYNNVKPEELDLRKFTISKQTVYSPITVEDKESTEKKREEAKESVEDVYTLKTEYAQNRIDLVEAIFNAVDDFKKQNKGITDEEIVDVKSQLKETMPKEASRGLSEEVFETLVKTDKEQLSAAKDTIITAIHQTMKNRVTVQDISDKRKDTANQLMYANVDDNVKDSMRAIAEFAVIPNVVYDPNKTRENRQEAVEKIDPVRIKQGQILVEEGQLITSDIYHQLQLVGLLDNKHLIPPFVGLGLLVVIMISAIVYYLKEFHQKTYQPLVLYVIVMIITITIIKLVSLFQEQEISDLGYLAPVATGGLLLRLLLNEKVAVISSIVVAICGSIIFNQEVTNVFNMPMALYFLISSIAGILFINHQQRRSQILQAGLFIAFMNIVAIFAIVFLKNGQIDNMEIGYYSLMAVSSGIISSVLTIGILPFFEAGFGILSSIKLIELSNPNHPLLRKILTETPGTYHHSVMVANLAEAACEAIGANGLLARVGSYYHDIGKTRRPHYFIENQMNIKNPHDRLPPEVSKNIIIAHAVDGADILRKHKFPREFVDIAREHHGTTLLKFFYYKAVEKSEKEIPECEYRYPGPKAQTKESAVIGIADSVEAAVRSMSNPTPEKIENLVSNIIKDRLQDGQLSECDLTLRELGTVSKALCETLNGIFHSRIEYPDMKKEKENEDDSSS